MKLRQLDYLLAVVENDLNVTSAARKTHTSQPGVSRQLRLLEEELGLQIFDREGRALTRVTAAGSVVIERAQRVLREIASIRGMSKDLVRSQTGTLSIGTTHTQARYVLPAIVRDFRSRYPNVALDIKHGSADQIAELISADSVDFVIASGPTAHIPDLVTLPCYRWHRTLIVSPSHPLARAERPTLAELAKYPLITYNFSLSGVSSLLATFTEAGLTPDVALTAHDADVIKAHVKLGLGVGIVANMAIDPKGEADLHSIDATHLFPLTTTWVGIRRTRLLRGYMYDFLRRFAPHLDERLIDNARSLQREPAVSQLFDDIQLPIR